MNRFRILRSPSGILSVPCVARPLACARRRALRLAPESRRLTTRHTDRAGLYGDVDDSDDSSDELADAYAYSPNVFEALPPPPNVGRKRQIAALVGGALLEFAWTGGVIWAPLMAATAVICLAPSRRQQQQREAEVAARAEERARRELLSRVPVTPSEGAQWTNRMLKEMWRPFVEPFLLKQCLAQWQDAISNAAPRGWTLAIADVSMGSEGPELSDFRALADPGSGRLTAVDCRMALDSDSMKVVVRGTSPLAAFTATVSGIRMAGEVRITPLMDQRMLLWGFKRTPTVNVKLAVKGPIGGADLSQFQFIQGIVAQTIQELLVEPRRGAVPLDYELRVEEAVATTINIHIEALFGLPRTLGRRRAPTQLSVVATETISRLRGATTRAVDVPPGSRQVVVRETVKVELPRREGVLKIEVRDLSAGGRPLGFALLWVSASMDGSTLFWGHERSGEALGRRWGPSDRPWRVALPLEGEGVGRVAEVRLGVSVEPWTYKQPLVPAAYRSSGPHTVVLQIVEARNLGGPQQQAGQQRRATASSPAGPNPFVQLMYDQSAYATAVAYGTPSPVFLESFTFGENASMLTRRVRLEAWSAPPAGPAAGSSWEAEGRSAPPYSSSISTVASLDGPGARREYYGGTSLNLDLTTEGAVQDRWYALGGGEGGEVRVRLAVVAGGPEDEDTQEVVGFCCDALNSASREALLVEVLSSRLQLPLSSIDSDDTDAQPIYRITYHGVTYVSDPLPPGSRRRSRTGRLSLRRRPAPPPGLGAAMRRPATPGGGGVGGGAPDRPPSSLGAGKAPPTEDILARASFPFAPEDGGGAGGSGDGGAPGRAPPRGAAGSSFASVAPVGAPPSPSPSPPPPSSSPVPYAQPPAPQASPVAWAQPAGTAGAANGAAGAPAGGRRRRWLDYSLLIECCDADAAPGDEVMGSVEIDAMQRMALSDGGCWEGWLKLNKDGGHVLVRITLLPASEPADIVLPPPKSAAVQDAAPTAAPAGKGGGGPGGGREASGAGARAGAAAAAGAPSGAEGAAASAVNAVNVVIGALEIDSAWLGQLAGRVQETQEGLRGQVADQVQQAADAVNGWAQQLPGWLGGRRGGGGGEGKAPEGRAREQQQQQQGQGQQEGLAAAVAAAAGSAAQAIAKAETKGAAQDKGSSAPATGNGAAATAGAPGAGAGATVGRTPGKSGGGGGPRKNRGRALDPPKRSQPGGGGFDVQKALMDALGGLGWDGGRRAAAAGGGGGRGKAGGGKGAALSSGWWDHLDVERQAGGRDSKQHVVTSNGGTADPQQEQQQQQQQPAVAPAPAEAPGPTGWRPPSTVPAPPRSPLPAPSAALNSGGSGGGGGGVVLASNSLDAALLSSAVVAAAKEHSRNAARQQALGSISSYPLGTGLASHPVTDIAPDLGPNAAEEPQGVGGDREQGAQHEGEL